MEEQQGVVRVDESEVSVVKRELPGTVDIARERARSVPGEHDVNVGIGLYR